MRAIPAGQLALNRLYGLHNDEPWPPRGAWLRDLGPVMRPVSAETRSMKAVRPLQSRAAREPKKREAKVLESYHGLR
jgi:hypothetical protein